jgi:hypothetical protein
MSDLHKEGVTKIADSQCYRIEFLLGEHWSRHAGCQKQKTKRLDSKPN